MKLLKILFSKKCRLEYSKKFINNYNEISNRIEEIYLEASNEYNALKDYVA